MKEEKIKYKIKLASTFVSEGKNLHAIQIYKQLINLNDSEEVYYLLAELYENMGFVDSAISLLDQLHSASPENNDISLYFGQFLLRNSKWFEAIQVLDNIKQSSSYVLYLIAYSYMMINEYELSREYFNDYLESNDNDELKLKAHLYLAKIEYELKNYDKALDFVTKAQFVYSDLWELNLTSAKIYYSLKMYNHALTAIQNALKTNSNDAGVQEFAGKIFYALEDFEKSEMHFSKAIELSS
ncbi:MAG: CDC27 family protein [Ignavibacteriaceae bacterium]|jgi:tetratricopeptide (TPR) repeat protein|nr:CDC27 family protein [Ignavibacteriaceae bacterium]